MKAAPIQDPRLITTYFCISFIHIIYISYIFLEIPYIYFTYIFLSLFNICISIYFIYIWKSGAYFCSNRRLSYFGTRWFGNFLKQSLSFSPRSNFEPTQIFKKYLTGILNQWRQPLGWNILWQVLLIILLLHEIILNWLPCLIYFLAVYIPGDSHDEVAANWILRQLNNILNRAVKNYPWILENISFRFGFYLFIN